MWCLWHYAYQVKIWDVMGDRELKRTYSGHTGAVRSIAFRCARLFFIVDIFSFSMSSNDGSKFLSASFDRHIRLWDTETGQCINTFTNRKVLAPHPISAVPIVISLFCLFRSHIVSNFTRKTTICSSPHAQTTKLFRYVLFEGFLHNV